MKIINSQILIVVVMSFFFLSCSEDENIEMLYGKTEVSAKFNYSQIEIYILLLINDYRKSLGLNFLERVDSISSVAQTHSNYMASIGEANHDNFPDRVKIIKEVEMAETISENVAFGFNSAKGVFTAWVNSEEHRANMIMENLTHFGIAVKTDTSNRNYFTNIFISK